MPHNNPETPVLNIAHITFFWRGLRFSAHHVRNHIIAGWSHITLRVLTVDPPPDPLTQGGIHTHALDEDDITDAGGLAAYYTHWLDREAATLRYAKELADWRQLRLI